MKKPFRGYVVMRLQRNIEVGDLKVSAEVGDHMGFLSVFKTKTAARKVWGKDAKLKEIISLTTQQEGRSRHDG